MFLRWIVIFLFLAQPTCILAQESTFNSKPRLIGGFGTRNTFIQGFNAPIFHIRLGAEFNKTLRMGAGFCFLKKADYKVGEDQGPFVYLKPVVNDQMISDTVASFLQLTYFTYFAEYVYYSHKRWQLSLPVQLGFGQSFYQYELNGKKNRELESPVFLYEPSVSVQYKLLRWLALGADVGYRFMLVDKKLANTQYNSPIYDLRIMIQWGEIFRAVFPSKGMGK